MAAAEAEDAVEEVEDDDVGYHTRIRVPRDPGNRSIWETTSIVGVAGATVVVIVRAVVAS